MQFILIRVQLLLVRSHYKRLGKTGRTNLPIFFFRVGAIRIRPSRKMLWPPETFGDEAAA